MKNRHWKPANSLPDLLAKCVCGGRYVHMWVGACILHFLRFINVVPHESTPWQIQKRPWSLRPVSRRRQTTQTLPFGIIGEVLMHDLNPLKQAHLAASYPKKLSREIKKYSNPCQKFRWLYIWKEWLSLPKFYHNESSGGNCVCAFLEQKHLIRKCLLMIKGQVSFCAIVKLISKFVFSANF